MSLNCSKCHVISFSRKANPIVADYHVQNKMILRVNQIKDLGVIFDSALTFNPHIDLIVTKSLQLCGFIKRICHDFTSPFVIITLFNTLVRSSLEYCCTVWAPYHNIHINRIENVQKKMVNYILFKLGIDKEKYSYSERLKLLGMNSLQHRRRNLGLRFAFGLLRNNIDCPELTSNISYRIPSYNSRLRDTFSIPYHRTEYGKHNPFDRIFAELNSLKIDLFNMQYSEFIQYLRNIATE